MEGKQLSRVIVIVNHSRGTDKLSLSSRLEEEIERARRYQHFLSLLILAVESALPEREPLKEIIPSLKENIRKVDIISLENNKLALLLPETSKEGAFSLGWRLKREIEFHNSSGGTKAKVRLGIACYPTEAGSGEELQEKAFLALEEGKSLLRR